MRLRQGPTDTLRPDQRLALACACACDTATIDAAAAAIPDADWPEAVRLFNHHFLAPVVLSRLNEVAGPAAEARLGPLKQAVSGRLKKALLLQATMGGLRDDHLAPLDVSHAMFKGLTLGARYYGSPGLRVARDIDVLVAPSDIERLLRSLMGAGYDLIGRLRVDRGGGRPVDHAIAIAHLSKEVALVSPDGVTVEIHHRVDASGNAFPTADLLARAETIEIWKRPWPVLSTTDLFVYICAHHAQHRWSRLHWVLDLSMMMRHPSFDADAVRRRAAESGFSRVVDAAMLLPETLSAIVEGRQPSPPPMATAFAADCLAHLDPARAPERIAREYRGLALLAGAGEDLRRRWRFRDRWTARLAALTALAGPQVADYQALPLPPRLHALYWITRPIRLGVRALGRAFSRFRP
ncbi:hypothetical protein AB7M35_002552 [Amorphus suaedae]